jgi:hypothetical protein
MRAVESVAARAGHAQGKNAEPRKTPARQPIPRGADAVAPCADLGRNLNAVRFLSAFGGKDV